jgi:holo-[acyl-carrier protein] synthase
MTILGIGTDITECLRIAQMIERHGEAFLERVYTPDEIRYCRCRTHATQQFTGRWSAKEAVLKALGAQWRRGIGWRDIEIRNELSGRLSCTLRGGARIVADHQGIDEVLVAISYCRVYATANAVAVRNDEE